MQIKATARELIENGLWDAYCEATSTNPWAVNEGLMDGDEICEFEVNIADTTD